MAMMPPEMESNLRAQVIVVLMHWLGLKEITINNGDLIRAGCGEDCIDLRMRLDRDSETLTVKIEKVLE